MLYLNVTMYDKSKSHISQHYSKYVKVQVHDGTVCVNVYATYRRSCEEREEL